MAEPPRPGNLIIVDERKKFTAARRIEAGITTGRHARYVDAEIVHRHVRVAAVLSHHRRGSCVWIVICNEDAAFDGEVTHLVEPILEDGQQFLQLRVPAIRRYSHHQGAEIELHPSFREARHPPDDGPGMVSV